MHVKQRHTGVRIRPNSAGQPFGNRLRGVGAEFQEKNSKHVAAALLKGSVEKKLKDLNRQNPPLQPFSEEA
jgi:hypothetical protein